MLTVDHHNRLMIRHSWTRKSSLRSTGATLLAGKWQLAKAIYVVMIEQLVSAMEKSPFGTFSVDETAPIDTVKYLSVEVYLVEGCQRKNWFVKLEPMKTTDSAARLCCMQDNGGMLGHSSKHAYCVQPFV
jgi:hypothetical protein